MTSGKREGQRAKQPSAGRIAPKFRRRAVDPFSPWNSCGWSGTSSLYSEHVLEVSLTTMQGVMH